MTKEEYNQMPKMALQSDAAGRSIEVGGRKIVIENSGVVLDKSSNSGSLSVTGIVSSVGASSRPSAPPTSTAAPGKPSRNVGTQASVPAGKPTNAGAQGSAAGACKPSTNAGVQASASAGKPSTNAGAQGSAGAGKPSINAGAQGSAGVGKPSTFAGEQASAGAGKPSTNVGVLALAGAGKPSTNAGTLASKPSAPSKPATGASRPSPLPSEAVVSAKKEPNTSFKPSVLYGVCSHSAGACKPSRPRSLSATVSAGTQTSAASTRAPATGNPYLKAAAKLPNLPGSAESKSSSAPSLSPSKAATVTTSNASDVSPKALTFADVKRAIMASDAAAGVEATLANARKMLGPMCRNDSTDVAKMSTVPKPYEVPKSVRASPQPTPGASAALIDKFDAMVSLAQESEDDKFKGDLFEKLETMKVLMENIEKLKNMNVKPTSQSEAEEGGRSWNDIAKSVERKLVQVLQTKTR